MATFNGSDKDDIFNGSDEDDNFNAGEGNNTIFAGAGRNTINAGSGNDTIVALNGDDQINAGEGNNTIDAGNGANQVNTGSGNDTIVTGSGDDQINAGNGDNLIRAGDGRNTINTGSGADRITAGSGDDQINAGEGNNVIDAGHGRNTINTGSGADRITAGSGDDQINAGEGSNIVDAGGGSNRVTAGAGYDIITAGAGNNEIYAGEGNNTVTVGNGTNRLYTGSGADVITTGSGNDTIYAGGGNDRVTLGGGSDLVYLGEGNDLVRMTLAQSKGGAHIDLWGEGGSDTLQLVLTAAEAQDAAVLADIQGFKKHLAGDGNWMYQFKTLDLAARQFEKLDLVAPVLAAADTVTTTEDAAVKIQVLANDKDLLAADNAALHVTEVLAAGLKGTVTIGQDGLSLSYDPGQALQSLRAGEQTDVTFQYKVADDQGFVDTASVTVTVTGLNDAAVIGGTATGAVKEDGILAATGKLSITDVDTGEGYFVAHDAAHALKGAFGALTIDANGNWSYSLDNGAANVQALTAGQHVSDTIAVTSLDGTSHNVVIDVAGANETLLAFGFESGFGDWQTLGSASLVTTRATEGTHSAMLGGNGASAAQLEKFLGLDAGKLSQIGGNTVTNGSAMKETVHLEAGQTLSFDFYFDGNDYLPYNDFAFVQDPDGHISQLSNIATVGTNGDSGWLTHSFTAQHTGDFTIAVGAVNVRDTAGSPILYIDHGLIV
jgi:VCBS repeat-containing protein